MGGGSGVRAWWLCVRVRHEGCEKRVVMWGFGMGVRREGSVWRFGVMVFCVGVRCESDN